MLLSIRSFVASRLPALMLGLVVLGIFAVASNTAQAGYPCGSYYGYSVPSYNTPVAHYDTQWHGYSHWTPYSGIHSHGHYDVTPHVTYGNFSSHSSGYHGGHGHFRH